MTKAVLLVRSRDGAGISLCDATVFFLLCSALCYGLRAPAIPLQQNTYMCS